MTYAYLALAVAFEVGWALSMKMSQGFTRPRYVVATVTLYLLSVVMLALATKRMDIGVGYAIWAGCGVALIAIAGMVYFKEPVTVARIAALGLIVTGIAVLQLTGPSH
jgi:multidrug transporter EmrE-like cation transporter